jgi:thymidylate synthase
MNQLYSLFFKKNSNIENIDEPINDSIKVKETTDVLKLQEIVIDTETSSKKNNDLYTSSKNNSFFSKNFIPLKISNVTHPVTSLEGSTPKKNSITNFQQYNFLKKNKSISSNHLSKQDEIANNYSLSGYIHNDLPNRQQYKQSFHFHEETQYLNLIREIINTGSYEKTRNGNTYTKFGYNMRFDLKNGVIPILTTKKMAWKTCFEELFWFIRGSTSNIELNKKNIHIWDDNCNRDFLDKRELYSYKEGDLGPIYGHQWRHFNAEYKSCDTCYQGEGIDQLQDIIDQLKDPETRTSRRLIMSAWNPCQISSMALPPCHIVVQFHVRENKYLSCALFQRSGDVGLGIPFNIASYSLLTHILAKHCDLEADEFVHFIGNCHIYEEHIDALKEQIKRDPLLFPRIQIKNKFENIEDYSLDDIEWTTKYIFHESIKMTMIP